MTVVFPSARLVRPTLLAVVGVAVLVASTASAALTSASRPAQTDPEPAPTEVAGEDVGAEAAAPRLELVGQRFAVDPNGDIQLDYLLTGLVGDPLQLLPPVPTPVPEPSADAPTGAPPDAPPTPPAPVPDLPALTLEVINYSPLADPDDVARLIGSDVDPDAFSATGDAIDGVAIDARPLMSRNDDGSVAFTLDVGTDVVDSVESRLKLERPGLHPLRVQLLIGDPEADNVVATAGTVVQRVAGAVDANAEVAPPIDLSVVTVTPSVGPTSDAVDVEIARTGLDRAIDLAATLDAPVTLEVPPTLIADAAAAPEGAERIATSLDSAELVAMPLVPLDVSSAVAVGREDAYTRLVRAGEDLLTESVPSVPSRRDIWITTEPLSAGGAQHLRDLGTRFVVIPADVFEASIDEDVPPTDRFVEATLPDGGTLPFLVVDELSSQLTTAAADRILRESTAAEWGVETLAEMLVAQADEDAAARFETPSPGRVPVAPRRSRVLTTPDVSTPDSRLLAALEQLAATTPAVRFTPASALTGVTDVLLDGGEPVTVELPDVAGPSLEARVELLDRTGLEVASAASMLPEDDPRITEWSERLDSLISTGYDDSEVEAATATLVAEANELKQAIQLPEPFTFTLTGRSGTIEIRIGNNLDEPLNVLVALDSTKVTFPEGDQQVRLRPLDETSVFVPVDAEANGTSSINLVVSTPAGEPLADPVTLTARVTALTGLGQVLTGGLVLVLLTWWFTHWRSRRRAVLAVDGRDRHPTARKVESDAL